MKARRHLAVWLAACAGCALPCAAGEKGPVWMVRVDVQMVSIPPQQALSLVPRLRDGRTVEAAVATLQTMIAKKQATLLAWPVLWTPDGERGVAETVAETKYPTEPFPSSPPSSVAPPPGNILRRQPVMIWPLSPYLRGFAPREFEIRNVGPQIEVEPEVSGDGRSVELSAILRYVRVNAFDRFVTGKFPGGIESYLEHPRFAFSHTTGQFFATTGKPLLAGCFHFQGKEPHVELFILRAITRRNAPPLP